ncbi:MAG TPA: hypothetical protein VIH57_19090 [Bacteroidales bacterium]
MRLFGISIIVLIAVSCSPTKSLQNHLNLYELPIGYIHDTKEINCHKFDSLIINLKNKPLDSVLTVSLKHRHVRFLVFYVSRDIKMNIELGDDVLEQPYSEFFLSSLKEESKRTGCFAISNKAAGDSLYTLDITMDTCKTNADYQYQESDLLSYSKMKVNFYPSETYIHVFTSLRRGRTFITEKAYTFKRRQPYLVTQNKNMSLDDLMSNMVESLSLSTKECVERIVNDVNLSITTNMFRFRQK